MRPAHALGLHDDVLPDAPVAEAGEAATARQHRVGHNLLANLAVEFGRDAVIGARGHLRRGKYWSSRRPSEVESWVAVSGRVLDELPRDEAPVAHVPGRRRPPVVCCATVTIAATPLGRGSPT